ncbi:unnamed protein product [Porites evermanni]|uniref:Uncharacterized protein n=1 Tax=Porites evermanni TaxID=104178 RepID=A0ABN8PRT5_9CNID|nr:unnamed protein product [Porites evermanni]
MVLQQCLACNTAMTDSCISCVCGHVFEYSKQIGGKRFSEYRAKLYSRLETENLRKEARRNKPRRRGRPKVKDRFGSCSNRFAVNHTSVKRNSKPIRKRFSCLRTNPGSSPLGKRRSNMVPTELLSRLPNALQEINRKIAAQNFIWLELQIEKKIS